MRIACTSQDTQEWFQVRVDKVTASCCYAAADFVWKGSVKRKDKRLVSSAKRNNYVEDLAWGMITRVPVEHYVTEDMDLGKQFERLARAKYGFAFEPEEEIEQTGFVFHPTLNFLGGSPDGLVGSVGGVEIKVPKFKTHRKYLRTQQIPPIYEWQCYCNMLCCEREWWDFCSYCPKDDQFGYEAVALPDEFRLFRKRFYRDEKIFEQIEQGAAAAIEEAANLVTLLSEMYPRKAATKTKTQVQLEQSLEVLDDDWEQIIEKRARVVEEGVA